MKALILSANTGQGHNSCSKAIQEAFAEHGDPCVIEDVFGLVSQKLSRSISKSHENTYRQTPRLSGAGYRFMERHPGMFAKERFVYHVMSIGRKQVSRCVLEGGYDTVICTHVLAAIILTAAMRYENLSVKSAFVATDYSCSPGVNGSELDLYFIPHKTLASDFIASEVPPDKIVPVGIPVQKAFTQFSDQKAAKEAMGIHPDHQHLLIMCGSMGCGPIPEMLRSILSAKPETWEITVVCGTNTLLKKELEDAHGSNPAVHIRGFEKQMPMLLSSADLYLTKPGGLSTSEAAAAAIPMVLIDAVGGCEENNLHHFIRLGAAVTGANVPEVVQACLALMNDPARYEKMADILRNQTAANASEQIWQEMNRLHNAPCQAHQP